MTHYANGRSVRRRMRGRCPAPSRGVGGRRRAYACARDPGTGARTRGRRNPGCRGPGRPLAILTVRMNSSADDSPGTDAERSLRRPATPLDPGREPKRGPRRRREPPLRRPGPATNCLQERDAISGACVSTVTILAGLRVQAYLQESAARPNVLPRCACLGDGRATLRHRGGCPRTYRGGPRHRTRQ